MSTKQLNQWLNCKTHSEWDTRVAEWLKQTQGRALEGNRDGPQSKGGGSGGDGGSGLRRPSRVGADARVAAQGRSAWQEYLLLLVLQQPTQ